MDLDTPQGDALPEQPKSEGNFLPSSAAPEPLFAPEKPEGQPTPNTPTTPTAPAPLQPKASGSSDFLKKAKESLSSLGSKIFNRNNKKALFVAGAILVAIIVVAIAIFVYAKFSAVSIYINANQPGIDIVIDGTSYAQGVDTPYQVKVSQGEHIITVSKEDFTEDILKVTVKRGIDASKYDFVLKEKVAIEKALEKEALFPAYDKDNKVLYFFSKNDKGFVLSQYRTDKSTETALTSKPISEIRRVAWSPNYKQVAVTVLNSAQSPESLLPKIGGLDDKQEVTWMIIFDRSDFVNVKVKNLNPNIRNAVFNPEGNKIAYYYKGESRVLAISNTDGSNYEPLATFKPTTPDSDVTWSPDGSVIAVFADETVPERTARDIKLYSFSQRSTIEATADEESSGAKFSPDGRYFVYESSGHLMVYDTKTEIDPIRNLNIAGQVMNIAWTSENSIAVYNEDGLWEVSTTDGMKIKLRYKESTLPSAVKNILFSGGKISLFAESGVYSFVPPTDMPVSQ